MRTYYAYVVDQIVSGGASSADGGINTVIAVK
jgi:hypothetical protein